MPQQLRSDVHTSVSQLPRRRAPRTARRPARARSPRPPTRLAGRRALNRLQGRLLEACAALIRDAYERGAVLEQWEETWDGPMTHVPLGTAQQR